MFEYCNGSDNPIRSSFSFHVKSISILNKHNFLRFGHKIVVKIATVRTNFDSYFLLSSLEHLQQALYNLAR
jgi:hypothetical protein